jgi:hypothetical protein
LDAGPLRVGAPYIVNLGQGTKEKSGLAGLISAMTEVMRDLRFLIVDFRWKNLRPKHREFLKTSASVNRTSSIL